MGVVPPFNNLFAKNVFLKSVINSKFSLNKTEKSQQTESEKLKFKLPENIGVFLLF